MSVAISLTEQSMRILWPPSPGLRGVSRSGSNTRPNVSGASEFAIVLPSRTIGPKNARYFRWKFVIGGGGKIKAPMLNGAAPARNQLGLGAERSTDGNTKVAAKLEREITDGVTAEMALELSNENYNQVSSKIAAGDWTGAVREMFNMKIKGGLPLTASGASKLEMEFDVAPDEHMCFFGATGKLVVAVPIEDVPGVPRGYVVELETTVSFRFGLNEAGWARLAQIVGGPVIRAATARLATLAAQQAVRSALAAAGIFGIAAVASLGLMYVSVELCNQARSEGARWGMLTDYSLGYLRRLQYAHATGTTARRIRSDGTTNRRAQLGWRDAERAIGASSLRTVERTIIRHFASNFSYELFESLINWEQRVSNVQSRVGDHLDSAHEVRVVAMDMGKYLASDIDDVVAYLGRARAGSFIISADQASRQL